MRTVDFDSLDDLPENGTQIAVGHAVPGGTQTAAQTAVPAAIDPAPAVPVWSEDAATPVEWVPLGTPEPEPPPADPRSIHAMDAALQSPSGHLGVAVQTVLENLGRLTPAQVQALYDGLLELGADNDEDGASARYGPQFDMTAFIDRMVRTTRNIEQRLYRPGPDGMQTSFTAQELGAISNANKNLMALIARHHEKVMGWERQRAVEAAHMAAARQLPSDLQDKYLSCLQAELEQRGL